MGWLWKTENFEELEWVMWSPLKISVVNSKAIRMLKKKINKRELNIKKKKKRMLRQMLRSSYLTCCCAKRQNSLFALNEIVNKTKQTNKNPTKSYTYHHQEKNLLKIFLSWTSWGWDQYRVGDWIILNFYQQSPELQSDANRYYSLLFYALLVI